MAVYRHIHIDYWQDGFVLDLTPEEKYFYIYLMTNSKASQCGIYELPKRTMETETGYNRETVEKLIKRFEDYKKVATGGKCNKGYINGILKQWNDNNIKSIDDLCVYEVSIKNRGEIGYGKYKCEPTKSKYTRELEAEDESIYQKQSEEQLREAREWPNR